MKYRFFSFLGVFVLIAGVSFAQQLGNSALQKTGELEIISTNSKESSDKKVATELVQTVLVDDFETAGEWRAFIPRDYGFAVAMRREGGPKDLVSDRNKYVLGVRVEFMKRDWSWVTIDPAKPIKIKGITKTLSVWLVGRNYKHTLLVVLKDYLDSMKFVKSERMIWVGWKKVNINIPDTIEQENYKITEDRGITFMGFRVEFEPDDMMGRPFYTYFDYLTADTDLFSEKNQNPDDMLDNW
jgi:hypothetical protein